MPLSLWLMGDADRRGDRWGEREPRLGDGDLD
jgi:hypothetical protein